MSRMLPESITPYESVLAQLVADTVKGQIEGWLCRITYQIDGGLQKHWPSYNGASALEHAEFCIVASKTKSLTPALLYEFDNQRTWFDGTELSTMTWATLGLVIATMSATALMYSQAYPTLEVAQAAFDKLVISRCGHPGATGPVGMPGAPTHSPEELAKAAKLMGYEKA